MRYEPISIISKIVFYPYAIYETGLYNVSIYYFS